MKQEFRANTNFYAEGQTNSTPNSSSDDLFSDSSTNEDNSIIDINSESLDLSVEKPEQQDNKFKVVPYWSKIYVHSYEEIKLASELQKEFYYYLRNKVINGEYVNIQSNTNYAFILYFDLLREYDRHNDLSLIEKQFKLLRDICPKTKMCTLRSIQDLILKNNNFYSNKKPDTKQDPVSRFESESPAYNPYEYSFGEQSKDKLKLNSQEIDWINKFWNVKTAFTKIEECRTAVILHYVFILKKLSEHLISQNTTLEEEVRLFVKKLRSNSNNKYSFEMGYYDSNYLNIQAESDIYLTIFKRVENSVREIFGHKRRITDKLPNSNEEIESEFNSSLGNSVNSLIIEFKSNVGKPDMETQILLNAENKNRWKTEFIALKNSFQKEEINSFYNGIATLGEANQENPNIRELFFEVAKFIAKHDNVQALKFYAKHIFYGLKTKKAVKKKIPATTQKLLFKTQEQKQDFDSIIKELIYSSDLQEAIENISNIFVPKRKKIKLDISEIKEVEEKHGVTVELLNGYLETEAETEPEENTHEEIVLDNVETPTPPLTENTSILKAEIIINEVQEKLINKIVANSFILLQDEVEKFALENGMFKNQLIDGINDICAEHLDGDALIEEEEENYIIEESYFREIAG